MAVIDQDLGIDVGVAVIVFMVSNGKVLTSVDVEGMDVLYSMSCKLGEAIKMATCLSCIHIVNIEGFSKRLKILYT